MTETTTSSNLTVGTNTTTTTTTPQSLFTKVKTLIESTPSTPQNKISDETKLRLYGLYKRCTIGTTTDNTSNNKKQSSVWNIVERYKFKAWEACNDLTTEEAMVEYVRVASEQQNEVGEVILGWLDEYYTTNGITDDDRKKRISTSISTTSSTNEEGLVQKLLGISPFIPRGQLDISYMDLCFALWQCIRPTSLPPFESQMCTFQQLEKSIQDEWRQHHPSPQPPPTSTPSSSSLTTPTINTTLMPTTNNQNMENQVVVGLSVRSLLDLYLLSKSYPAGSEVIITPPITIQGMVQVFQYHDLEVKPLDIPYYDDSDDDDDDNDNDENNSDDGDGTAENPRIGIDLEMIQDAITDKTVAIMIVHPFGLVCTSQDEMKSLRDLVRDIHKESGDGQGQKQQIDILEDCAECFTGGNERNGSSMMNGYGGSPYADVQFFSFGMIKTATALGGGVAVFPYHCDVQDSGHGNGNGKIQSTVDTMKRMQYTLYGQQGRFDYLWKVMKAILFLFLSRHFLLCGILIQLMETLGINYDELLSSSIKGFPTPTSSAKSSSSTRQLIQKLRQKPSNALLYLLRRRIGQKTKTLGRVQARMERCCTMNKILNGIKSVPVPIGCSDSTKFTSKDSEEKTRITLPQHLYWLYPIIVHDPDAICDTMKRLGYDVPRGTSQIGCVSTFLLGTKYENACPNAKRMMDRVLYLPITSHVISETKMKNLVAALEEALSSVRRKGGVEMQQRCDTLWWIILFIFGGLFIWSLGLRRSAYLITNVTYYIGVSLIIAMGMLTTIFVMLHFLRRKMSNYYTTTSLAFAKYYHTLAKKKTKDSSSSSDDPQTFIPPALSGSGATLLDASTLQDRTSQNVLGIDILQIPDVTVNSDTFARGYVVLAGATGFIGSLLLRELLANRQKLGIEGVVLICRPKRNLSPSERLKKLLSDPIYSNIEDKDTIVTVVEGELGCLNLGISDDDMDLLCNKLHVTHVINCAASVSFTSTLEDAAVSNITSALQLQALSKKMKQGNTKYIYVSTAFVHGKEKGSMQSPLPEQLFNLGPYDPLKLYESMVGTQSTASAAMNDLGFPNTYTFSKCICEHLLLRCTNHNTTIIRPSIVGPSVQEPYEGWAGDKPSTLIAAACLYLKNQYNLWGFRKELAPIIPVDVVCRFILAKTFSSESTSLSRSSSSSNLTQGSQRSSEESYVFPINTSKSTDDDTTVLDNQPQAPTKCIYTATWDAISPKTSSFIWYEYAYVITQLGAVKGHVDRAVVYLGLLSFHAVLALNLKCDTYRKLHNWIICIPTNMLNNLLKKFGLCPSLSKQLDRLSPFLDLPVLFYPFTTNTFYFQSDLVAPSSMNGERYMFSCAVAAERFIQKLTSKRGKDKKIVGMEEEEPSTLTIAGKAHPIVSSDLWWSLSQPKGNYAIRFIGWIVIKILRQISTDVTVDLSSLSAAQSAVDYVNSLEMKPCLLLAPTHRSLLDFIIITFVSFAVPELCIDIPNIAAADEFARIPILGWLAKAAGAFFLKRGKGVIDSSLELEVQKIKRNSSRSRTPTCFEVFLEGKRSRDRRYVKAKTGFLKCLHNTGGDHIILPITINYEMTPDQNSLSIEANGRGRSPMSLYRLCFWLKKVFQGKVNVGRIHVVAATPLHLHSCREPQISQVAVAIQQLQQHNTLISSFHLKAGASVINISADIIQRSIEQLGYSSWPHSHATTRYETPPLPITESEIWSIFLHYAHIYGQFFTNSHPRWAAWLNVCHIDANVETISMDEDTRNIVAALTSHFEAAENLIDKVISKLKLKGFHEPSYPHIIQYAQESNCKVAVPSLLLNAAILMRIEEESKQRNNDILKSYGEHHNKPVEPLFNVKGQSPKNEKGADKVCIKSEESFGSWGYKDSRIVLNVNRDGSKCVTMKGDRYHISGKPMPFLVSFFEDESNMKISPTKIMLPATPQLSESSIPSCDLSVQQINKLYGILNYDKERVSTNEMDRIRHGTGHSQEDMYMIRSGRIAEIRVPDVVVYPQNEEEVDQIVCLAAKEHWCLIPFGGGTNVSHATRCPSRGIDSRQMISVDMQLMKNILSFNEEDRVIHVQAGITGSDLVRQMESRGYTIGHEPDSLEFSTLGGWIATKASGMKQNKYGNIENIVKDVCVSGPKGRMWQNHHSDNNDKTSSFGRVSTSTDLSSLMLGSEGSLGIITSAVIKVWPLPDVKEYDGFIFPTFDDGFRFLNDVAKMGALKPASIRLLDNRQFRLGQAMRSSNSLFQTLRNASLKIVTKLLGNSFDTLQMACATVTFEGTTSEVSLQKSMIKGLSLKHGGLCAGSEVGKIGYDMTFAIAYLRDFAMTYGFLAESFETFVPWSKVSNLITLTVDRIKKEHRERFLPGNPFISYRITQLYDEGVCVYFYFSMNFENVKDPSHVFSEIEHSARNEIMKQGGSLSHHHGVGKLRSSFMDRVNSPNYRMILNHLKEAIDPDNIFGARNGAYSNDTCENEISSSMHDVNATSVKGE